MRRSGAKHRVGRQRASPWLYAGALTGVSFWVIPHIPQRPVQRLWRVFAGCIRKTAELALLAQCNAAARAFRSRSSGLFAGAFSFAPARGADRLTVDLGGRTHRKGLRRGRLRNLQA